MYCPECGKSNPEGLQNCKYCNAELKETVTKNHTENAAVEKIESALDKLKTSDFSNGRSFIKKHKKLIISFLCAVGIIAVLGSVISFAVSPKRTAEKYLKNLMSKNMEVLYDCVALPEGKFITEENFVRKMEDYSSDLFGNAKFTDFSVEEYDRESLGSEGKFARVYEVKFFSGLNGESADITLVLAKQKDKQLLVFPRYKVVVDDIVCTEMRLTVFAPPNSVSDIDGIPLETEDVVENDEESVTYRIKAIFCGEHKLTVSGEYIKPNEYELNIYRNDTENSVGTFASYYLNDTAKDSLKETASADWQLLFDSAIQKKAFSEVGITVSADNDDISSIYDGICKFAVKDNGEGLKSITFSNYIIDDDEIEIDASNRSNIYLKYSYTFVKTVLKDGKLVEESSADTRQSSIRMTCILNNGEWQLDDINGYYPNY